MEWEWHAEHRVRGKHAERTAKSYFLQSFEHRSRQAKLHWARVRGLGRVTNLQHDGVVVVPAPGVTVPVIEAALSAACSLALGYTQPVEEKPFGDVATAMDAISDSDSD